MKQVALITGASSGIGEHLARIHAAGGRDLVLVARRGEVLQKLKSELERQHGVAVVCIAADLTEPNAAERVYQEVKSQGIQIDYLINNAGFGGHGVFHERDWADDQAMIELNVLALADLTHRVLQDMVKQQRGKILNVASTAGFLPGPLQATYYATKAFVLSFSQAIAEELKTHGITVTALCPGPVETGFADAADLEGVESFKHANRPDRVAKIGYDAMLKGRLVVIDDWKLSFLLNWVVPFLPRWTVLRLSRRTMEKS